MKHELDVKERCRVDLLAYCALRQRLGCKHPEAIKARNALVRPNRGLVIEVARRYHCRTLELGDLIAYGTIGLISAIERFDPSRECSLATAARWWIRHEIGRAVADLDSVVRVPVHVQQVRDPETREACARARAALSLNASISEDGVTTLADVLADPNSPDALVCLETKQAGELLWEAIRGLPAHLQTFAHAWMREQAITDVLGRERGQYVERAALASLAAQLKRWSDVEANA